MATNFADLMQRVTAGDSRAAEELVAEYEPEIRRAIRFRLRNNQLRRILDSTDICQSVFAKFFLAAASGRCALDTPHDLIRFLTRIATRRVIDRHRKELTQRRLQAHQAEVLQSQSMAEPVDAGEPAELVAEHNELLVEFRARLTDLEAEISRLRVAGKTWLEISTELGQSPQALRKRLERACDRILPELGLGPS